MTEEQILKEMREIYDRVPAAWRKSVVKTASATPTMAMVIDKALEDPDFPEEKKEQIRLLKDKGYFDKQRLTEDPQIALKINNFINREMKKKVKEGKLPNKKQLKELKIQWQNQNNNS